MTDSTADITASLAADSFSADVLQRLHATVVRSAADRDLVDVAYRTVDTPIGNLLLATTARGLVRVGFACEGLDTVLAGLAQRVSPRILRVPSRLDPAARQVEEYFAGRRRRFDLPVDFRLAAGFRKAVLERLPEIAYGSTASYAALAAEVGHPRAVRAVGTACARNPLPIVVPCHRVVRSDGTIGNYLGGPEVKRKLLEMERAAA
jgi:methylated-DNA-[protein]-cysteine S-methyltransferase